MRSSSSVTIVSKCTVYPRQSSTAASLKLSVSDLPMLSCHYIQKGVLLPQPPLSSATLVSLLELSLSETLSYFPALAGRLVTDGKGYVHIFCNDEGVEFFHAKANHITADTLLPSEGNDLPAIFRCFFQLDNTISYAGHTNPLLAVQVTEINDGVFIGCTANHAVVDGTSFWNFFNTFAEIARGASKISRPPDFNRDTPLDSLAVLQVPDGGPKLSFSTAAAVREKIFRFSRESMMKLKYRANNPKRKSDEDEISASGNPTDEISSFQSLCAQLWRSVTRARNLNPSKTTTFRMAVNCRHRLQPQLPPLYFGNAIQSVATVVASGNLLSNDINWSANKLHKNVAAHGDTSIRQSVKEWERSPRVFPLGNPDGAMVLMGSSPRFPMYDNDFGWGRPLAVRSGGANKFDGKISAFPDTQGEGAVDLEVVLAPETMAGLENDPEFMQYVS